MDPLLIERDPFVLARLPRRVFVGNMTKAVQSYNQMSMSSQPILTKTEFEDGKIDADKWKMPDSYKLMTSTQILGRLIDRQYDLGLDDRTEERNARIVSEMKIYKNEHKLDLIRLMCYIVDRLTETNQIWGVGRGSSVSSYVLFLIGVHDIDSVLYDLDFTDFMKPN